MSSRATVTIALAAFLVVAVFLWSPAPGEGAVDGVVDLSAPASSVNCTPCHASIAESDVPGLIFTHGNHLLVECGACHIRPAHEAGSTYRPTMESCFICHGLLHGEQGTLAAGECDDCHTPEHVLRPTSHSDDWPGEPHARASNRFGPNSCMLCHTAATDCDACHAEEAPDVAPMPGVYLRNVPIEPDRPSAFVDTRGRPTMSQCAFCHVDVDETRDDRLIFAHDPHLRRDYDCVACHPVFPHRAGLTIIPDMLSCYRCHSLVHGVRGEFATQDCLACHPTTFELIPPDHTQAFLVGEHKEPAEAQMESCTMCHTSAFCTECHVGGYEMADAQASQAVIPANHREREWIADHGGEFLGQRGACSTCHTSQSCTDCHSTPMPHPPQWLARHAAGNGYPKDDCNVCHTDRSDCQDCHHAQVAGGELIAANCVDCHDEMRTDPPTAIKNIGLAEHAVHFNVEERVGRPYVCDDCHIGFTVARISQLPTRTQAHDLRLCYDCHGNLGIDRVLIAPYPGSELCRRCHTDLRL
ncbi:MAG: hypothetical protein U1E29_09645 [Coriobacteriia bacterium]|nr:hypothetical protein [Coriobacteriia bacterium]